MMRISVIIATILMVLLTGCDRVPVDCDECQPTDNYVVNLRIITGYDPLLHSNGVLTIYDGNINDSLILVRRFLGSRVDEVTMSALLYKDYSATLRFTQDRQRHVTVASACPRLRYVETQCDKPCYIIYDNVIDLRRKFY